MFKSPYLIPFLYLLLLPLSFVAAILYPELKHSLALFPRDPAFLNGVITTVFVHKDLEHFSSNCLPLFVCLFGLFYFYRDIAAKTVFLSHILTGFAIWMFARPAYHIGASGLVYALVFFILISGLIRRNKRLRIFAFIVLLFQSGLLWGVFPLDPEVSWESHLMGALCGISLAFVFRNEGPENDTVSNWEEEDPEEDPDEYQNI